MGRNPHSDVDSESEQWSVWSEMSSCAGDLLQYLPNFNFLNEISDDSTLCNQEYCFRLKKTGLLNF